MRDSAAPSSASRESHKAPSGATRYALERSPSLAEWLRHRVDRLTTGWTTGLATRASRPGSDGQAVLDDFLALLVAVLPESVGPHRRLLDPIWQRAAELYGSFGVARGLAAGEVVEEFQLLRSDVVRMLLGEPPGPVGDPALRRDILALNRFLDVGAARACVGYTDRLFFDLFQGGGVASQMTPEVIVAVRDQLADLRNELLGVVGA